MSLESAADDVAEGLLRSELVEERLAEYGTQQFHAGSGAESFVGVSTGEALLLSLEQNGDGSVLLVLVLGLDVNSVLRAKRAVSEMVVG